MKDHYIKSKKRVCRKTVNENTLEASSCNKVKIVYNTAKLDVAGLSSSGAQKKKINHVLFLIWTGEQSIGTPFLAGSHSRQQTCITLAVMWSSELQDCFQFRLCDRNLSERHRL